MIIISKSAIPYRSRNNKPHETYHLGSTENLDELHAFAKSIGLKTDWFQNKKVPHYDLFGAMIQKAIAAGAKTVTPAFFIENAHRTVRETVSYKQYGEDYEHHIVTKEE